jgi:hypothetical protein
MSVVPVDVGLVLDVRFADRCFRQTIASCKDTGRGEGISAADLSDPTLSDWSECDGRAFALRVTSTAVEAIELGKTRKVVGHVATPAGAKVTR